MDPVQSATWFCPHDDNSTGDRGVSADAAGALRLLFEQPSSDQMAAVSGYSHRVAPLPSRHEAAPQLPPRILRQRAPLRRHALVKISVHSRSHILAQVKKVGATSLPTRSRRLYAIL